MRNRIYVGTKIIIGRIVLFLNVKIRAGINWVKKMVVPKYHIIRIITIRFIKINGGDTFLIVLCLGISYILFTVIKKDTGTDIDFKKILEIILTINGAFSAILITYLFNRVSWKKERKLELYNEAEAYSKKITEFRRMLKELTDYYQVWDNDDQTHGLLHTGKYRAVDFYDFEKENRSDYKSPQHKLINELKNNPNFNYGNSVWYLAMISFVVQRSPQFIYHEELYNDFDFKGVYSIEIVERWLDCEIMGTIGYYKNKNVKWINYYALRNKHDQMLAAASRINKKYENRSLDNSLIIDIAEEMNSFILKNLHTCLIELRKGIRGLELLITLLISISLFFGVILPVILLLLASKEPWFFLTSSIIATLNIGLILFFLLKLPFLVNKELKWL